MKTKNEIPTPTPTIVRRYLEKWDDREGDFLPEQSLEFLFRAYPENKVI
jgi:hypothetical protein